MGKPLKLLKLSKKTKKTKVWRGPGRAQPSPVLPGPLQILVFLVFLESFSNLRGFPMEGVSFFGFFGEFQVFELGLARAGMDWPGSA